MALRDLNDAWSWIQRLIRRVARLESGAMLENSSITRGRMRFIGGLLRLDSGALLELIGQWRFFGNGAITGDVYSEGKWTQVGDYDFTGDGDLAGDVDLSGNFNLTGKFTSENVRIEDGKIYVGAGGSLIVIDGATGKIIAGNMTIDPADGGSVAFPGGAKLDADPGGGVRLTQGTNRVFVGAGLVSMQMGTRSIAISASGIQMTGADTIPSSLAGGAIPGTIWSDGTELFRVV